MIGLDTNILVRYFTQDDRVQSQHANRIMAGFSEHAPGFISVVTLAETMWVLQKHYGLLTPQLAEIVRTLLQTSTLVVQHEQQVYTAMASMDVNSASFSDALIGAIGAWAGCSTTLTFDRKAARLPTFTHA